MLSLANDSHTIRIACRDPLQRVESLNKKFDAVFHCRAALLEDLRWSEVWAATLVVAQEGMRAAGRTTGADVRHVIQSFSVAPQRFESVYTPLCDFLCFLPAVIKIVKMVAEDWREPEARGRATAVLSEISAHFVFDVGLIADCGQLAVRLTRAFAVHDSETPSGLDRAVQ